MIKTQNLLFSEPGIKSSSPCIHTGDEQATALSISKPRLKYINRDQLLFRTVKIDRLIAQVPQLTSKMQNFSMA